MISNRLCILLALTPALSFLFEAKGGDEHDEEKEAFDNVEKGEAAPIVPQDSKDSKAAGDVKISPEKKKEAEKSGSGDAAATTEEKKSNGAHTPV